MDPRTIFLPKEDGLRRKARAQKLATFLGGLSPERAWELVVRPAKRSRSNQQSRFERGVCCVMLSKAVGYEPDEIHNYLCGTYWGWKQVPCPKTPSNLAGVRDVPVRTTTSNAAGERDVLNKEDYWDFVDFIQRFGAKHGVLIPDPDPEYQFRGSDVQAA